MLAIDECEDVSPQTEGSPETEVRVPCDGDVEVVSNRFALPEERARFGRFLAWLRATGRTEATLRSYRADWQDLTCWFRRARGSPFEVAGLREKDASEWRDHGMNRGSSGATVTRRLAFLRRYVQWLAAEHVISWEEAESIRDVKQVALLERAPRVLSDVEVNHLLRVVEGRGCRRDQAIFHVLLDTGVKVGEVVSMCVGDVDFASGELRIVGMRGRTVPLPTRAARKLAWSMVERGLLSVPEDGELVLPASGGWPPSGRVVQPPPGALPELRRLPRSPMPMGLPGDPAEWPLFVGEKGGLSANGVQRVVRKYGVFARLDVSPQVMRHTFAFAYWTRTQDLVALAEVMGHQNIETTRIYTRASSDDDWSETVSGSEEVGDELVA